MIGSCPCTAFRAFAFMGVTFGAVLRNINFGYNLVFFGFQLSLLLTFYFVLAMCYSSSCYFWARSISVVTLYAWCYFTIVMFFYGVFFMRSFPIVLGTDYRWMDAVLTEGSASVWRHDLCHRIFADCIGHQ